MKASITLFFILLFLNFSLTAYAATPTHWQIIPNESSLTFTATQNDAPITGSFKKFSGDIFFDPDHLAESKATILVDTHSIASANNDVVTTLVTPDWLNVKIFPQATFTSTKFVKTGDKTYQAQGTLKIRDKSMPVTLNFTQVEQNADHAKVTGSTSINRTPFGVGQGEWSSVKEVKDKVDVNFTLSVVKIK